MQAPAETVTISEHQVNVYEALSEEWRSSHDIAVLANVMPRTARKHLLLLTTHGIAEAQRTSPGYSYRLNAKREPGAFESRIKTAREALS